MGWRFRLPSSKRQLARELDEEMALHLELRAQALAQRGLAPHAARLEAERLFGDVSAVRADCLAIDEAHHTTRSRWNAVTDFVHDVRYATRALLRDRAFTLLVCGIFALGIGAATALFSVYDAVVLRPLDVPAPGRVMWATMVDADDNDGVSPALWFAWSERAKSFSSLSRVRTTATTLTGLGTPSRVEGLLVSEGFFSTLDLPASRGRRLDARDFADGAAPVVVIGTSLWRQQFGSDPAIVGALDHARRRDAHDRGGPPPIGRGAGIGERLLAPRASFRRTAHEPHPVPLRGGATARRDDRRRGPSRTAGDPHGTRHTARSRSAPGARARDTTRRLSHCPPSATESSSSSSPSCASCSSAR
jgi:hypothetical protein